MLGLPVAVTNAAPLAEAEPATTQPPRPLRWKKTQSQEAWGTQPHPSAQHRPWHLTSGASGPVSAEAGAAWAQLTSPIPDDGTTATTQELVLVTVTALVGFCLDSIIVRNGFSVSPAHLPVLFFWVALALACGMVFGGMHGRAAGMEWIDGYVLEWSLSLDNLFVFCLIFKSFRTPQWLQPLALLYWVPVGTVTRLLLYTVLNSIFDMLGWVRVICGLVLVFSAASAAFADEEEDVDINDFAVVHLLRRCLGDRLSNSYDEKKRLFLWVDGNLCATRLVLVIVTLWVADFFFAMDSVGARVAQVPDQYAAFSSTVLAMFSMRAFGVFLEDLVETFSLLKYGICAILALLGVQLVLCGLALGVEIPPKVSGDLICVILCGCIGVDLLKRACSARGSLEHPVEAHPAKHVQKDVCEKKLTEA